MVQMKVKVELKGPTLNNALLWFSYICEKLTCWSELLNENVKHRVVCDDDDHHETIEKKF